jgi:hypothetical protein
MLDRCTTKQLRKFNSNSHRWWWLSVRGDGLGPVWLKSWKRLSSVRQRPSGCGFDHGRSVPLEEGSAGPRGKINTDMSGVSGVEWMVRKRREMQRLEGANDQRFLLSWPVASLGIDCSVVVATQARPLSLLSVLKPLPVPSFCSRVWPYGGSIGACILLPVAYRSNPPWWLMYYFYEKWHSQCFAARNEEFREGFEKLDESFIKGYPIILKYWGIFAKWFGWRWRRRQEARRWWSN